MICIYNGILKKSLYDKEQKNSHLLNYNFSVLIIINILILILSSSLVKTQSVYLKTMVKSPIKSFKEILLAILKHSS